MAYKGHHWDKGELITSEKLNHMESGIAEALGNTLIARATGSGQVTAEDAAAAPLANLVIAGKSEQVSTTGAQLLDMSDASGGASYGITATVNSDGTYVSNGTAANSNINIWLRGGYNIAPATDNSNVLLILEQGKTYVISDIILLTVVNGAPVSVKGMYTCNVTDGFKVTGIRHPDVPSGTKLSNKKYYPMVNAGATAKPWEPYTGGQPSPSPAYPQPIISTGDNGTVEVTGRNLLNITDGTSTDFGITITRHDGVISINGTPTINKGHVSICVGNCKVKPGTYTVSFDKKIAGVGLQFYNNLSVDGALNITMSDVVTKKTKDVKQDCNDGILISVDLSKSTYNFTFKPMLNYGNTAQPWRPYQSQHITIPLAEPLRGLGEYQDRIMCKAGVWGVERNIGAVNNSKWTLSVVYQGTAGHRFKYVADNVMYKGNAPVLCTAYPHVKADGWKDEGDYISTIEMGTGAINIRTLNPDFDTLEAFKVAMANAVTIYPLATPTWKPLPAETQSALNALTAYQGRTTITVTAGGPAADVGLEYVRDINTVIADLQAQIIALKGGKTS